MPTKAAFLANSVNEPALPGAGVLVEADTPPEPEGVEEDGAEVPLPPEGEGAEDGAEDGADVDDGLPLWLELELELPLPLPD